MFLTCGEICEFFLVKKATDDKKWNEFKLLTNFVFFYFLRILFLFLPLLRPLSEPRILIWIAVVGARKIVNASKRIKNSLVKKDGILIKIIP